MNAFELGFREGLVKSAKLHDKEQRKINTRKVIGAGLIAPSFAAPISHGIISTLKKNQGHLSDKQIASLQKRMRTKAHFEHVDNVLHSRALSRHVAKFQGHKGGVIFAHRGHPEVVAHELGHIANYRHKVKGPLLHVGRAAGPLAGLVVGGSMAAKGEEGSAKVKAAPLITAAGHAATLGDEAAASIRGYKHLKAMGIHSPGALKHMRRNLAKAFLTYGIGAGAMTAPVAYLSWKRGWSKKKKKDGGK